MAAAPWYLLAGGIFVVIVGYFIARVGSGSGHIFISPKMSDEEIERLMNEPQGSLLGNLLILLGFLTIIISLIWRIVRIFEG